MRKFLNPGHLPSTPKSYTFHKDGKEHRLHWHSSIPWGSFYSSVVRFAADNGLTAPTAEQLEDHICGQLGSGWCTSDSNYRPAVATVSTGGCKSCGRR